MQRNFTMGEDESNLTRNVIKADYFEDEQRGRRVALSGRSKSDSPMRTFN